MCELFLLFRRRSNTSEKLFLSKRTYCGIKNRSTNIPEAGSVLEIQDKLTARDGKFSERPILETELDLHVIYLTGTGIGAILTIDSLHRCIDVSIATEASQTYRVVGLSSTCVTQ
ncbi:hypothetical protein J6590_007755 [Homalodisca vitripennis]|nr:hypothetical protein J6590_007755 [Homalodisca vitripennis]